MLSSDLVVEQALIQRAQQGDRRALDELYQRHAPGIFRYLLLRVHDRAVAEDLTGEVFIRMVKSIQGYRDRGLPFGAWLYRIAHDRVVDHLRYTSRHPLEGLSETAVDPKPGPELLAAREMEAGRLAAALATLSDDQRLVIQLRFVEGHNLEATAQLMRRTVGAVKALQHRALQNLAGKLGQ
jgi:RNA polymerase sigma-70 factor (ECF subfamily)